MKTMLSILFVLGGFYKSQGQTINNIVVKPFTKPIIIIEDSSTLKKSNFQMIQLNNPLTLVGKNGTGFNTYQSGVDNMFVIKPDSLNKAQNRMPNAIAIDPSKIK